MGNGNTDIVECHSDYEYAQRTIALRWEGQRLEIGVIEANGVYPMGTVSACSPPALFRTVLR